ncbi:DUF4181 domain-containing protein [Cytobacillus oceanisediminis]|uniref:Uncharacterized protein DUF4181 n=1 Tax=Cytobacillus oceanisediminis TaxID=665099 RepID=A0A562JWC7_9BACI|nr:DUF4181 domain-containing protein [Cytobacillus oceanisediminis]TWH87481.1 uncharacterized protein DUF4181 [Cytobacillus oceanisediminis]
MAIYIFVFIVFLIYLPIYSAIKKKYNIQEPKDKEKMTFTYINKLHKIVENSLTVVILIGLFLLGFVFKYDYRPSYLIVSFLIIFAARGIMEWKYEKESRLYFLSVLSIATLFIVFLGFEFLT